MLPVNNLARGVHSTPPGAHGELAYPAVRRRPRHGEQRNKGTKGGRGFSGTHTKGLRVAKGVSGSQRGFSRVTKGLRVTKGGVRVVKGGFSDTFSE